MGVGAGNVARRFKGGERMSRIASWKDQPQLLDLLFGPLPSSFPKATYLRRVVTLRLIVKLALDVEARAGPAGVYRTGHRYGRGTGGAQKKGWLKTLYGFTR